MNWIVIHEDALRLLAFVMGFFLFLIIGLALPYRKILVKNRLPRWLTNLSFNIGNSLIIKFIGPVTLSGVALSMQESQTGLFNLLHIPVWAEVLLALALLDALIYWQHRLFHGIPFLWRLHRLHHSDTEFDVTTAGRFHPLEIVLSYLIKIAAVISLGIAPIAIILFEVVLNFSAMFNHSNFKLGVRWEGPVRSLIVTPSMHRIHHSPKVAETNSNYGFCLSCWDRLFRSYREKPEKDPKTMAIGLEQFRSPEEQRLLALFLQPFTKADARQ